MLVDSLGCQRVILRAHCKQEEQWNQGVYPFRLLPTLSPKKNEQNIEIIVLI